MANLAIKGHKTQGSEVIARLKMLGGMNMFNLNGSETNCYYYINDNNKIYHCLGIDPRNYIYYTLEEFLEKFPYKVGDTVLHKPDNTPYFIIKMFWKNDKVLYELSDKINLEACSTSYTIIPDVDVVKLQPYKEETMEQIKIDIPKGYEFFGIDDDNKIVLTEKQPQYPKTYEECCKVLNTYCTMPSRPGYKEALIAKLQELLICRDAYWKIAGNWKPDVMYGDLYCIGYNGNVVTWKMQGGCRLLAFPTEEMRDTFYENFKDLIEQCKELL